MKIGSSIHPTTPLVKKKFTPHLSAVKPKAILVVEDDTDIRALLWHYLEKEKYKVLLAKDGEEGLEQAESQKPDLIVLDLMLPKQDGLSVLKELRSKTECASIPVLILTAKGDEADRIVGLELGADDYVTKPFSPREVAARVKALLRRAVSTEKSADEHVEYVYGSLRLDSEGHKVFYKKEEPELTAKEFGLLKLFLENRGKLLSRDRILARVWGADFSGGPRTVDVHIRRLREKIPLLEKALTTVKSYGYRLEGEAP
ncbi:MAG: response regulator transcription factor [candidate division Zixibacteria bacterium]|nr:response regulator transcription factor [candidate division Zixibacteria bacterium]MCI0595719.1 response regulator transcription factor [candidate division Zixibacteria bacterium]